MIFARVLDGAVVQVGGIPKTAYAQGRWWDLRPRDPAVLAQAGWFPLVEVARPADTDTTTCDLSYALVNGQPTQVWTARPWTVEELAARTAAANGTILRTRAAAAIATNTTDQEQAGTIRAAADTLANTTGTFTTAQASTHIRSLATAVRLLAAHDIDTKKQLNTLIRLVVEQLDSTDGTQ